ncbi:MAG TPA: porin [Thermoanaerobaculaceae bacterium]|nr:porin [Thermoanaerobaculaceae bacterium]HRS14859.1 porin [Thermoanaerobaculaceae bacterium]
MNRNVLIVIVIAACLALAAAPAPAQFSIASPDGKASLRLGVLAQAQGEWLENADGETTAQNLFIRRIRLMMGGKIGDRFTLFLDTDSPNLGKASAAGQRTEATMYIQDLILTYQVSKEWKLDVGKLLVAHSYHSGQSAGSLLGVDYGPYTFVTSAPIGMQAGRDYGVAGRGYLAGNHLEVRAGVYQGVRGTGARNPLRTAARVVWYPWDAQSDFFYPGTSLGKKRVLGVGVSYDRQKDFSTAGADVYLDVPVGANAVTAQVDFARLDGGKLLPTLAEQDTLFAEAGFLVKSLQLTPYLQYSRRHFKARGAADEQTTQLGVAYWQDGHRLTFKLGVGRIERDNAPDRLQVVMQAQLLLF